MSKQGDRFLDGGLGLKLSSQITGRWSEENSKSADVKQRLMKRI